MPSMLSNRAASGEGCGAEIVDRGDKYSRNGDDESRGNIDWFGRNFNAYPGQLASRISFGWKLTSAFGVVSVCMKMVRMPRG